MGNLLWANHRSLFPMGNLYRIILTEPAIITSTCHAMSLDPLSLICFVTMSDIHVDTKKLSIPVFKRRYTSEIDKWYTCKNI